MTSVNDRPAIEAFGISGWRWWNEPRVWSPSDGGLSVHSDPGTDYWRITHSGFIRDSGHLLAREMPGDFQLVAAFVGEYAHQYDQAGIMLRIDERNWIKTGVEWVDGEQLVSAVVTREFSDWSVAPLGRAKSLVLLVERAGDAVTVRYGIDDVEPTIMLRQAYFPPRAPVLAGVMCASPEGPGYAVRFTRLAFMSG